MVSFLKYNLYLEVKMWGFFLIRKKEKKKNRHTPIMSA